jgi:acyl dehydratase
MVDAGLDIDGYVFLSQKYRLIRSPALGEPLQIDGYVRDLAETSRGPVANEIYRFSDSDGHVCLESELTGLLALPDGAVAEGAPALPRRDAQPADGWTMIQEKQVTPDDVRVFSQDVGNEVHFDVEFARQHGFRAPIAQGIMSAVWLISALYSQGAEPSRFFVDIRYLRPVFWDDYASLWVRGEPDGSIGMVQSRNEDGKVTADMTVLSMSARTGSDGA